jgi:hypothetical protein
MGNNYTDKYLKYKAKYLTLKQQIGGNYIVRKYDSIYTYNKDIEELNHLVTPMNAYNIVNKDDQNVLTTTGVVDCVVVLIYNSNYGRYIGHFLKFNEFEEACSNACEINRNPECNLKTTNDCVSIEFLNGNKTYVNNSSKIYHTLPLWINETDTEIHIINSSELFKVYSRYKQIFSKFSNAKFYLYLKKLEPADKQLLRDQQETNHYIEKISELLISQSEPYYQIYGIKPNGSIFAITKDDLKIKKYIDFYSSRVINRISVPNINKKCVGPYFLNMKYWEDNQDEFEKVLQLEFFKKEPGELYNDYSKGFYCLMNRANNKN